jgi:hypothetical protein
MAERDAAKRAPAQTGAGGAGGAGGAADAAAFTNLGRVGCGHHIAKGGGIVAGMVGTLHPLALDATLCSWLIFFSAFCCSWCP